MRLDGEGSDLPSVRPAAAPTSLPTETPEPGPSLENLSSEMLAALLPYLEQSVMVVRENWEVVADLKPPGGLSGAGRGVGAHVMVGLHPDDALRLFETGREALRTDPGWTDTSWVRLQQPDGSFRRFELTLHNRFDDPVIQGIVVSTKPWVGSDEPVARHDHPEMGAATLADHLPIGVAILSHLGRVLFANPVAAELLGAELGELYDALLTDAVAGPDQPDVTHAIAALAARPGRTRLLVSPAREAGLVELDLVSRPAGEADASLVIVTVQDVTHRLAREQQLEHLANHDPLTGLANRTWLLDHLGERLDDGDDLVVAFIDLDRFKSVNDRLGHEAGDIVLAAVGAGLEAHLQAGEVAARVGGDEFVVVASDMRGSEVAAFGRRIRDAVTSVAAARRQRVGVSVGLARSVPGDEPGGLLRRADASMYDDKRRMDRRVPPRPGGSANGQASTVPETLPFESG